MTYKALVKLYSSYKIIIKDLISQIYRNHIFGNCKFRACHHTPEIRYHIWCVRLKANMSMQIDWDYDCPRVGLSCLLGIFPFQEDGYTILYMYVHRHGVRKYKRYVEWLKSQCECSNPACTCQCPCVCVCRVLQIKVCTF